jgi:DNA-binding MarR family transcriptional regulator
MDPVYDFWCFRLGSISRKLYRTYNSLYSQQGVTVGQSFVLFDLLFHEGSSVKDIAGRLQLDSSAITGLIDRLAKEGLVERVLDSADRRSLKIFLTLQGKELAEEILPLAEDFNQQVKGVLESSEAVIFETLLHKLDDRL